MDGMTLMDKLFSIVIPVYNAEKWLATILDEVISQTYRNTEIILIDDGSNDRSLDICQYYSGIDKRIQVIHTENHGPSHAKNCGIRVAKGDYITFIDSDDEVDHDYIETLARAFTDNVNLVITDFDHWHVDSQNNIEKSCDEIDVNLITGYDVLKDYCALYSRAFANCGKAFRLEIIKKYKILFPEDMIMAEDQAFNDCYYELMGGEYRYIARSLYHYKHYNVMSLSKTPSIEAFRSDAKCLCLKKDFFSRCSVKNGDLLLNQQVVGLIRKYRFYIPVNDFLLLAPAIKNPFCGVGYGNMITLYALKNRIVLPITIKKRMKSIGSYFKRKK